ncbi:sensor histidine kinase [Actinoplanes awajinensis]|uniref:sensor histidine kinase n=1 Tax=Actinoplanes awajinensis TaxID=135946 RepID=UPI000A7ADE99|nr:ATP-binding protein [Actinoplanes awajinensis]
MNTWSTGRWPVTLAGLSGVLLLATLPTSASGGLPLFATNIGRGQVYQGAEWSLAVAPIAVIALSLVLVRWWPYLIVAGGLAAGWVLVAPDVTGYLVRLCLTTVPQATILVGVLGCAQSLLRRGAPGLGAAMAGLALGARLVGSTIGGLLAVYYQPGSGYLVAMHAMVVVGLAGAVAALWTLRRGDPAADGPADREAAPAGRWQRWRLPLAGTLAVTLAVPLSQLDTSDVAALMGVDAFTLQRHPYAQVAMIGAVTLVVAAGLAALGGLWSLGGALTAAVAQVAVAAPLSLATGALAFAGPARWLGALAGLVLGVLAVLSRWRVAMAGSLAVAAATSVFIAHAATTGSPERIAEQHRVVPGLLMMVLVVAAGTAVAGAAAPPLNRTGAIPAALGPLAAVIATGGTQTLQATYLETDGGTSSNSHLTTSGLLLLVAGAAVAGLGVAHYLTERWAQRQRAEQIRQEAATAERDRLARPIHDGVLQVLAMVQRQGAEAGASGTQLAALAGLAGEQEAALRKLLAGGGTLVPPARGSGGTDLRTALTGLAAPGIEVAAPAQEVPLAEVKARELVAAVRAALDNVRRHAGDGARVWILLEDEGDGVRVTVRDDGAGFAPGRLDEAQRHGRLGVAQSMRGRITDLKGTMSIESSPGQGTEVEFWVPRGI